MKKMKKMKTNPRITTPWYAYVSIPQPNPAQPSSKPKERKKKALKATAEMKRQSTLCKTLEPPDGEGRKNEEGEAKKKEKTQTPFKKALNTPEKPPR